MSDYGAKDSLLCLVRRLYAMKFLERIGLMYCCEDMPSSFLSKLHDFCITHSRGADSDVPVPSKKQ